jgi:hypothetical protein
MLSITERKGHTQYNRSKPQEHSVHGSLKYKTKLNSVACRQS